MNEMELILRKAVELVCSDVHLAVGLPPMCRVDGEIMPMEGEGPLSVEKSRQLCYSLLRLEQQRTLESKGEVDFSYALHGIGRFRVNVFRQRGSYSAAVRLLAPHVPTVEELGLPNVLKDLALRPNGLILVTGQTGAGKSTTLAAMVNYINANQRGHILTLEDPIEYLHRHNRCIVNQREIGEDSQSFASALRASLREDPDVLLVGEMRDLESITIALSAAETGHLVLSTLHTVDVAQTIDRLIDMFPPYQQQQIRVQLSSVLQGVISQRLIRAMGSKGRVAAVELMICNDAIRNIIREGKTQQIPSMMQMSITQGMLPMDYSLSQLVKNHRITVYDATANCSNPELLQRYLM